MSKSLNLGKEGEVKNLEQLSAWLGLLDLNNRVHFDSHEYSWDDPSVDAQLVDYKIKHGRPFNHNQFKQDYKGRWVECATQ